MGGERVRRPLLSACVAVGLVLLAASSLVPVAFGAHRSVFRGRTSQGRQIKVTLDDQHRLIAVVVDLEARCNGGRTRSFEVDFGGFDIEPQSANGAVRGSIDLLAGSFFGGGASYREHASFVGHLTTGEIAGSTQATRKYDNGPRCTAKGIRFSVDL